LLHVIDVQGGNAVSVLGGVIQHDSHRYQWHREISFSG
jgi:hypothetical protein